METSMTRIGFNVVATPLGDIVLTAAEGVLTSAHFAGQKIVPSAFVGAVERPDDPFLARAGAALARYFEGGTLDASIPLAPAGTAFQQRVWGEISRIAAGKTVTYAELARAVGALHAARAVGAATGRNPLCIFIPCHRVVGSDGALTGYAGGLERKRHLLALERASSPVPLERAA